MLVMSRVATMTLRNSWQHRVFCEVCNCHISCIFTGTCFFFGCFARSTTEFNWEESTLAAYIKRHSHVNLIKCTRLSFIVPFCAATFAYFISEFNAPLL